MTTPSVPSIPDLAERLSTAWDNWLVAIAPFLNPIWAGELNALAEAVDDALEELSRLKAWPDISTAPKDGTPILVGRHIEPWGFVYGWAEWVDDGDGVAVGWVARGFYEPPGNLGLAAPTHWRPLPPAPGGRSDE